MRSTSSTSQARPLPFARASSVSMVARCSAALALAGSFLVLLGSGVPALAHTGGVLGGFQSGFTHPIVGWDHLLAMLAVGIWGAQIGGRSVWTLPVVFPLVMAIGGVLGTTGIEIGPVELAIALSVIVLGGVILLAWRAPEWASMALVGMFAIFHGFAHGRELPGAADPIAYGFGFVVATGLIHVAGIGIGLLLGRLAGGRVSQALGGAIALAGAWFVAGASGLT